MLSRIIGTGTWTWLGVFAEIGSLVGLYWGSVLVCFNAGFFVRRTYVNGLMNLLGVDCHVESLLYFILLWIFNNSKFIV
jgi:hypothetical protein